MTAVNQTKTRSTPGGGREGYSTKICMGMLRPEVQTLTILQTVFDRRGNPFMYLSKKNGTPFIFVCFIPKWQFYLPFSVLQLVKSQTFYIPPASKTFRVEHPRVAHQCFNFNAVS